MNQITRRAQLATIALLSVTALAGCEIGPGATGPKSNAKTLAGANPSSLGGSGDLPTSANPGSGASLAILAPNLDMLPYATASVALQGSCDSGLGTVSLVYGGGIAGAAVVACNGDTFAAALTLSGAPGPRAVTASQGAGGGAVQSAVSRVINYTIGMEIWSKSFLSPGSMPSYGFSVDTDGAGNSYFAGEGAVTGAMTGTGPGFVVKVDKGGNLVWGRQVTYSAFKLKIGRDGFIYLTGGAGSIYSANNGANAFVTKMDAQGTVQWTRLFPAQTGRTTLARAIDADKSGNVYYGGWTRQTAAPFVETHFVTKLDGLGNLVWTKPVPATLFNLAVDGLGGVYTSGAEAGVGAEDTSVYVSKLDPSNGNTVWRTSGGVASKTIHDIYALAVSGDGKNVYFAGRAGSLGPPFPGGGKNYYLDALVGKMDGNGAFVWIKAFGGATTVFDSARGVAVDAAGNVYVAGDTDGSLDGTVNLGSSDRFVRMYNPAGALIWSKQSGTGGTDATSDIGCLGVDAEGGAYVTQMNGVITKYQ